jgi:hypothetical protein
MSKKRKVRERRARTLVYLLLLLALLSLAVTATYTWFTLSATPRVSNVGVFIATVKGLELAESWDAPDEDWGQSIDFRRLVREDSPLRPVTWSDAQQCFLAVSYGIDGRVAAVNQALNDRDNANRADARGYYVLGTFYARTDKSCTVSLANAVSVNDGADGAGTYVIGTPLWDGETLRHEDGGLGAECAVRVGMRITYLDASGQPDPAKESRFCIYEPNCDRHLEAVTGGDAEGYVRTPSVDGTRDLVSPDRLILQTASEWTEARPVQREVTIKSLGDFLSGRGLFRLRRNELVRLDLYIWLEGQDADCTNRIEDAQILANIQFDVGYEDQSGLVDIPDGEAD